MNAQLEATLENLESSVIAAHPSLARIVQNTAELSALVAVLEGIVTTRWLLTLTEQVAA